MIKKEAPINLKIELHFGDLPDDIDLGDVVAIDTEAMGLSLHRDRLCLIQLKGRDSACHLVQFSASDYTKADHIRAILQDPKTLKIFHFGRFDLSIMNLYLGVQASNVYCTKIASRLCRTFTDRHGLKDLCKDLLGIEVSKHQQTSDWGASTLTHPQKNYAATDVLYLHALKDALDLLLKREGRLEIAKACFEFLPMRAHLDVISGESFDVFPYTNTR